MIWKDNRIPTNQANQIPGNRAANNSKNARDRNVNANSASAKNKVAASRAVAVNRVVSKADDKPGYLEKESGGRRLPPLFFVCEPLQSRATTLRGLLTIVLRNVK